MSVHDLRHDPETCTRDYCGRCKPSGEPDLPPLVDHDVAVPTDQQVRQVNEQVAKWSDAVDLWSHAGAGMLARASAWQVSNDALLRPDDGSDEDQDEARRESRSDKDRRESMWDAQAARYADELAALLKRVDADMARLTRLNEILCPDQPHQLTNRELLSAQIAAEGWCVSCHRDAGWCEPLWEGRSRDGCQWCAKWRRSEGGWPPLALVKWRHRNPGRQLTTADVARELGRAS